MDRNAIIGIALAVVTLQGGFATPSSEPEGEPDCLSARQQCEESCRDAELAPRHAIECRNECQADFKRCTLDGTNVAQCEVDAPLAQCQSGKTRCLRTCRALLLAPEEDADCRSHCMDESKRCRAKARTSCDSSSTIRHIVDVRDEDDRHGRS